MTLALTAAALVRMIDPLAGNSPAAVVATHGGRRPRELEREKQLVLKAIKEIELDYQMRKIAERDYREMVERYRTRAMRLMGEIEAGDDFRVLIERELTMRLKLEAGKPTEAPAPAAAQSEAAAPATAAVTTSTCATCATVNDDDARFCKTCGAKLI
jgi:aconitase B